jgi:hypothetical protein
MPKMMAKPESSGFMKGIQDNKPMIRPASEYLPIVSFCIADVYKISALFRAYSELWYNCSMPVLFPQVAIQS